MEREDKNANSGPKRWSEIKHKDGTPEQREQFYLKKVIFTTAPWNPPSNYFFFSEPLEDIDTYDSRPPMSECRIVRRKRERFEKTRQADRWARRNYKVVERLHTARWYAWRIHEK